jgi:S-adenosylmethionine synthetase
MSKEHATQSHPSKLEQEVMELKACNEYLRQKLKKLDARIQYLIRLGLETTRPEALDQWQEEEEL